MKLEAIYVGPPHGHFEYGKSHKFYLEKTNLGNRSMIVEDNEDKTVLAIYHDVFEFLDCWSFVHKVKTKTDAPG